MLTSGPILATLVEIVKEQRCDLAGVVDDTQVDQVFHQWRTNGVSAWKIPLLQSILDGAPWSGKASIPWTPESVHDFMHAKIVVADDTSFVGSFNLSRSGERNAENVLEIRDQAGRRPARGLRRRDPRALSGGNGAHVIDPLERWRELGLPDKPDYAGLLTYAGMPYTQDPAELAGVDVAVVGAPTDDLVSDRPGTRFGPRAIRAASCPPGPHLEAGIDAFAELRVVDFGDAAVVPADVDTTRAQIERTVGQVVEAGAIPVVLGGDHSITEPNVRAVAGRHGPVGLVHFDTHTDTGTEVFGVEISHGTPMFRLVRDGHVVGARYVQIGLRGYWPGETELAWQREQGITSFFMHDVRDLGIREVVERTVAQVGDGPVFLTVDVDVLDPSVAPGTGTPEPGGMTSVDLLWACREVARRLELVGMDVVEVIPTAVGSADVTALVADRSRPRGAHGHRAQASRPERNAYGAVTPCPQNPNRSVSGFHSERHPREGMP